MRTHQIFLPVASGRRSRGNAHAFVLTAMLAILAAVGCGPAPTVMTGVVTLDGKPVERAGLEFYPVAGDGQTSCAFTDAAGRYRVTVSPTKSRVVIRATRIVGKVHLDDDPKQPLIDAHEQYLPERYTDRRSSQLTADPKAGATRTANFELTSESVQP